MLEEMACRDQRARRNRRVAASALGVVVGSAIAIACAPFSSSGDAPASTPTVDGAASSGEGGLDGADRADAAAGPDGTSLPEPPTFLSPSTPSHQLTTAEPIDYLLGFLPPEPMIVSSFDGMTTPTETDGSTFIAYRSVQQKTTIHWTVNGGPRHTFDVDVNGSLTQIAGYVIYKVRFVASGEDGPLVVAQPSEVLALEATFKYWDPSAVQHQLVYGIDEASGCLSDKTAGSYSLGPVVGNNVAFPITAPAKPGVYDVRVAFTSAPSCTMALAAKEPLSDVAVAEIIVR